MVLFSHLVLAPELGGCFHQGPGAVPGGRHLPVPPSSGVWTAPGELLLLVQVLCLHSGHLLHLGLVYWRCIELGEERKNRPPAATACLLQPPIACAAGAGQSGWWGVAPMLWQAG